MLLKKDLYGLNMASKSFHKYFGDFIRDLGFTPSISDQELWIRKSDEYEGYDYIATHVNDVIITDNIQSQYINKIDMQFKVRYSK